MRASWSLLLLAVLAAGCTRAHYRESADRETYPIIAERIVRPTYDVGRTHLEPPPQSRLADPYDPDRPPRPPDDPAASIFMQWPGGMRGSRKWDRDGVVDHIEPCGWEAFLGPDENGVVRLNQDRAVEVALLNSREYQFQLENVYLAALSLTLNRFEFDLRWFLRNNTTYTHFGTGGFPTETNTLAVNTNVGFARNFAAGGQLLVDFANSFVYEFTGGQEAVRSNLAITLIQPLLRNAGRRVRLEGLTQAERDVLYSVRDFARFRKQFWAGVAVQDGGYLDLLLAVQTLRNNQANYKQQEETYRLYTELFRGGRASVVELDQFFQSLQTSRQAVVDAEAGLQAALDNFKLRLGLPPRMPVELDDSFLERFVLTEPALEKQRDALDQFQRERLKELGQPPPAETLRGHFAELRRFAEEVLPALDKAEADLLRWEGKLDRFPDAVDESEQRERERATFEGLKKNLSETRGEVRARIATIEKHRLAANEANREASWEALTVDLKAVVAQLDAALATQTQARIYLIELPRVDLKEDDGLARAKQDRLDLQNEQAQVTDAWRKVTVAANALRSDLNVVATADLATDPDSKNPFAFAAEASRYTVGLQFDGPLNRQAERNVYRASLINYQRARRSYMALSDQVEFQVRQDLRQLRRLEVGFDVARQQLLSAARQVENARLILLGPRDRRKENDTTTLNLLQALNALLGARNALAASYINYEQQRVQLLLDLEALQLDQRGFPLHGCSGLEPATGTDPDFRGAAFGQPAASPGLHPGAVRLGAPPGAPAPR